MVSKVMKIIPENLKREREKCSDSLGREKGTESGGRDILKKEREELGFLGFCRKNRSKDSLQKRKLFRIFSQS
jgi:hypothetical protein